MSSPTPTEKEPTNTEVTTKNAEISPIKTTTPGSNPEWMKFGEQISGYISETSNYATDFLSAYRVPLLVLGGIIIFAIVFTVTSSLLTAINHIPLVKPIFQLVGLGYTIWFVWRYLVSSSKRQELFQEWNSWQSYLVGQNKSDS